MHRYLIDDMAETLARGLSRRRVLQQATLAVAGALMSDAASRLLGRSSSVAHPQAKAGAKVKTLRQVSLHMTRPNGRTAVLHLIEEKPGRVSLEEATVSIVARFPQAPGRLSLALYHSTSIGGSPTEILELPLVAKFSSQPDARRRANFGAIPILTLTAVSAASRIVPEDYQPIGDCSVLCCSTGLALTAPSVCCDIDDSDCGFCCDGGSGCLNCGAT